MNKKIDNICPACGSSKFENLHKSESFHYKNNDFVIDSFEYSKCSECGFELINPAQIKRNESKIKDQFRHIDGLLTGEEIKAVREKYNLTQEGAARIFGGGPNAFSKYERGEVIQSQSMDRLLRSAYEDKDFYSLILEKCDDTHKRTVTRKRISGYKRIDIVEVNIGTPSNMVSRQSKREGPEYEVEGFEETNVAFG